MTVTHPSSSARSDQWESLLSGNMWILRNDYGFDTVAMHRQLLRLADLKPASRVLDMGTGSGWMAMILAEGGHDVVAMDVDSAMLARARQRWQQASPGLTGKVRFAQGDAQRLPFRSADFDAVFSFDVLHHLPDCPRAVTELLRVCGPSGVFAVADLNAEGLRAVEEVMSRGGESHFDNGCRVEKVAEVLERERLRYERHELEFVTAYILRPAVPASTLAVKEAAASQLTWSVRRARTSDRRNLVQFRRHAISMVAESPSSACVTSSVSDNPPALIAEDGDRVLGTVSLSVSEPQQARIRSLCVDPDLQDGRFVGDLLAHALRFCRDNGILKIVLSTPLPEHRAWMVFHRCGFKVTRERGQEGRKVIKFYTDLYGRPDCERLDANRREIRYASQ